MRAAGTLKTFRHITGPMDTQVTMAEKSGPVLVLSSNNYLGLADHPEVIAAGKAALDEYGAGTASRALHLRHVFDPRGDREGAGAAVAHRSRADLCLVLDGEHRA